MLFIVSEVELRPAPADVEAHASGPAHHDRARRRREVRALLALRPGRLERPGMGRSLRALPGRAGGADSWLTPLPMPDRLRRGASSSGCRC